MLSTTEMAAPGDGGRGPDAIPVLIVAFRNAEDVERCLRALALLDAEPHFAVQICENGGPAAYDALLAHLTAAGGACAADAEAIALPPRFRRGVRLSLRREPHRAAVGVILGEAHENYGYAGGVNAFLEPRLGASENLPGVWILNPDTQPAPAALAELVAAASRSGSGMIGSRLVVGGLPEVPLACGLAWRRWRAATGIVAGTDPAAIAAQLDAPSGASMYVTGECLRHIGPMPEAYFLYFAHLEWGLRAKRACGIGYAHHSIVIHELGTTIGSATSRRLHSPLSVYLDFRNRLLFVRRNFQNWLVWTAFMEAVEILEYARLGAFANAAAALRGMAAGLRGQRGRPDRTLENHRPRRTVPLPSRDFQWKRRTKLGISLAYFAAQYSTVTINRFAGRPPRPKLRVLYYHAVRPEQQAGFARQVQALARWARVVAADWHGETAACAGRTTVALTFDDAFQSVQTHAIPVLQRAGFPCTVFAPTGWLGRAPGWRMETEADRDEQLMTQADLAALPASLVAIGSHTVSHPHLTALADDEAKQELLDSRRTLEAATGRDVRLFAFPYGDFDARCLELCRDCGYTHAFTIEPRDVPPASSGFARGRIAVDPGDGRLEFYLKAHGAYGWMALAGRCRRALQRRFGRPETPWYESAAE